jgi:hypothetical protein
MVGTLVGDSIGTTGVITVINGTTVTVRTLTMVGGGNKAGIATTTATLSTTVG